MNDYVEMAKEALTRPSDFGWHGRDDMFESWGFTGVSWYPNGGGLDEVESILKQSNFICIKQFLEGKFPDSENIEEIGMNHWAAGNVDTLICKVINVDPPDKNNLDKDDISDEFKEIADIVVSLRDDYPIFNEEDFSERESQFHYECFVDNLPFEVDKTKADIIHGELIDSGFDVDYDGIHNDDIFIAAYAAGAEDHKNCGEEWKAWEFLNPSEVIKRYQNNWKNAGQMELINAA